MFRAILYFVVLGAVIWAGYWLLQRPGEVTIVWLGHEIEMPFAYAVGAFILLVIVGTVLTKLLWWLIRAPARWSAGYQRRRRERGYRALTLGMVAVAAGDAEEARRQTKRAEVLLDEPPLTMLLAAQSAQLDGDEEAARRYFTALLDKPETKFLGLRGLYMQATRAEDAQKALEYAEQASAASPGSAWVLEALFDLKVRAGRWDEALEVLGRLARKNLVEPETARRWRAVINVERSRAAEARGALSEARATAKDAWRACPTLVPAAAQLANAHLADDSRRRAWKTIREAWRTGPHPILLDPFRRVVEPLDPVERFRRAQKLAEVAPGHAESRLMLAELAIEAGLWPEAREALAPLVEESPSVRACRLMADVALADRGDEEEARRWLARAGMAMPDPVWVCGENGAVQPDWTAVCRESGAFDSLEWRVPSFVEPALPEPLGERLGALIGGGSRALTVVELPDASEPSDGEEPATEKPKEPAPTSAERG